MSRRAPVGAPRHLAGSKRVERLPETPGAAPAAQLPTDGDEAAPVARVHRSRLAFALSVTVAAVPILLFDNFPATADTGERTEVEAATGDEPAGDEPTGDEAAAPTITIQPLTESTPSSTEAAATGAPAPDANAEADAEPAHEESVDEADSAPVQALRGPSEPAPAPTAPPAPTTTATQQPSSSSSAGDPNDPATWDRLAQCESDGRWHLNTGNGYYGGLQFSLATWRDVGGAGYPHEASRDEQIRRGKLLQARYGWGQWPHCSSELGYR